MPPFFPVQLKCPVTLFEDGNSLTVACNGNDRKIICAYHAGQGNVDAWLDNPAYSSDGVTLDVIPMQNTDAYASRVLRARDVYRKYYFPEPTPTPVNL